MADSPGVARGGPICTTRFDASSLSGGMLRWPRPGGGQQTLEAVVSPLNMAIAMVVGGGGSADHGGGGGGGRGKTILTITTESQCYTHVAPHYQQTHRRNHQL